VAATGGGGVEAVYADESIWLTQKMLAQLYDVDVRTINYHLKKVFSDSELQVESVIRNFRITASDGKSYDTLHYKLPVIIAVGYKVNSERAVQFRKWAIGIIEQFTIKAYVMDDERLKAGGSILTDRYFDEQLQRIREIRLNDSNGDEKVHAHLERCQNYTGRLRPPRLDRPGAGPLRGQQGQPGVPARALCAG